MSLPWSVPLRNQWSLATVFWVASLVAGGQTRPVVCAGGAGSFRATATTRVTVWAGARRAEGFAERACQATLTWNGSDVVVAMGWKGAVPAKSNDQAGCRNDVRCALTVGLLKMDQNSMKAFRRTT